MTETNISHLMFTYDQQPARRKKYESFETMMAWIEENIGPQTEKNGFTSEVVRKGKGWEMRSKKTGKEVPASSAIKPVRVISWYMHIEDPQLATMFALKFTK